MAQPIYLAYSSTLVYYFITTAAAVTTTITTTAAATSAATASLFLYTDVCNLMTLCTRCVHVFPKVTAWSSIASVTLGGV
jgi:hypothetical protein